MTATEGDTMTEIDRLKAALETQFPGWDIWTVPRATVPGPMWCARRKGAAVAEFNADTAAALADDLGAAEALET